MVIINPCTKIAYKYNKSFYCLVKEDITMEPVCIQKDDLLINSKRIVNVLMDSPLYFTLPVCERKAIIERVFSIIQGTYLTSNSVMS